MKCRSRRFGSGSEFASSKRFKYARLDSSAIRCSIFGVPCSMFVDEFLFRFQSTIVFNGVCR